MSRTYTVTGINLKSMPIGETDRLVTILTQERGLVRVVAVGSRKHNSSLAGRSGSFVINQLLIAKGRSLDKIAQAETLASYPGLSQDLRKLTASQYLAELALHQALSDQPQEELFCLLSEHLARLEQSPTSLVLAHLTQAVFQLLVLSGFVPQLQTCCISRTPINPNFVDRDWQVGFSVAAGGVVKLSELERLEAIEKRPVVRSTLPRAESGPGSFKTAATKPTHGTAESSQRYRSSQSNLRQAGLNTRLSAVQLALLQHLAESELPRIEDVLPHREPNSSYESLLPESLWLSIEGILRQYAQYHLEKPIRSATLIDTCFVPLATAL